MASLVFEGEAQNPADFSPEFAVPTSFSEGEVSGSGTFVGTGTDNNGWILQSISGVAAYAEIVWSDSGNGSQSRGPVFVNASGDGYLLLVRSYDVRFFRAEGGVLSQVGSTISQSVSVGDVIRLEYDASGGFTFYHNSLEIGSESDSVVNNGLSPGFTSRAVTAHIESFDANSLSTVIRKGSQFDVETALSGTVTAATLNGNAITVDSQTGTTVTLTDSDGSIATSGEYDLVLTDDSADPDETITVQVNVVGLPTNTARKDGGLLTNLSDLTLDAVNASGTLVKQLTGITTDASGAISPIDLSDLSEAVGDTLKISLHSAASGVGVTFEQALELI